MENQYYQQTVYYRRAVGEIAESRIRFLEVSLRFISIEVFSLLWKVDENLLFLCYAFLASLRSAHFVQF